jgi:hypothetical protein
LAVKEEPDFEDVERADNEGAGEGEEKLYDQGQRSSMERFIVSGD